MTTLYLLPYNTLLFLIMALIIIMILQTFSLTYGFFSFKYQRKRLWRSLLDLSVLLYLAVLLILFSITIYHVQYKFMILHSYTVIRYVIFVFIIIFSILISIRDKEIFSLSTIAVSFMTLPVTEQIARESFPVILEISLAFWFILAVNQLLLYHGEYNRSLSAFSVKEALDTMDFGILFCNAEPASNGVILLSNEKMQDLIVTLTGKILYNGYDFYQRLLAGNVLPECRKETVSPQPVYMLPDGCVWLFNLQYIKSRNKKCALLTASDITKYHKTSEQLYNKNKELEAKNKELKTMLENLEDICQSEETFYAKSRIHDILGQQISLILRSVREHKEPDETLLQTIADSFTGTLKKNPVSSDDSLKRIADNFQKLGITVSVTGSLPSRPDLAKTFYEVITEAITNAVHHGYATKIFITMKQEEEHCTLTITDNGSSKNEQIAEGGGLTGIRHKIDQLGGTFTYTTKPHFSIFIKVYQGGSL